jgi:hypothetical protein
MHCPIRPFRHPRSAPRRFLFLAATLSLLAPLLASCASWQALPGRLTVDLQAVKECQQIAGQTPPPSISPSSDYRKLAPQALAQLHKANDAITARNSCEQKVIDEYAGQAK